MNRSLALLVVAGCAVFAGCSSSSASDAAGFQGENASRPAPGGSNAGSSGGSSSGAPTDPAPSPTDPAQGGQPSAGKLTAGVWDDNLNYEFFGKYLTSAKGAGMFFSPGERDAAHARATAPSIAKTELDITLLLDTTSSMGDELQFLQNEFQTIADTVKAKFPQMTPRFGLVLYRDLADQYVTRPFPFTSDVAQFRQNLAAQAAFGGGDIPEAVPEGLQDGISLGWRSAPEVARVMFWVADAPQHAGEEQKVKSAVNLAVQKGIKIFPVASSGVDASAELTMRATAQMTGGRYVFLTDDSGIGNTHAEPHIPCYVVTRLEGAIVRMVESEMNGVRAEPAPTEVLRTVGDPKDGKCTMKDQSQVVLY